MWWILYWCYVMFMCGGQNLWFCKVSLIIFYVGLFECRGPWMLKTVINCHVRNRRLQNWTEKVPCIMLLNYLHTFVFNTSSVFNTLYLHNWHQILASSIYNIRTIRKILVCNFHFKCQGSTAAILVYLSNLLGLKSNKGK